MNVLVVAAHPDDEAIGCGGIIRWHIEHSDTVYSMFMTSGQLGCPGEDPEETGKLRIHEAYMAGEVLGTKVIDFWDEQDGSLKSSGFLVGKLAELFVRVKPDIIYCPAIDDVHADHRAAAEIVQKATAVSVFDPAVWQYEVWSPFSSYDRIEDISPAIGMKILAIRRHESQVKRIRFDEAALALARFRGELHNRPHGPYAEVFRRLY